MEKQKVQQQESQEQGEQTAASTKPATEVANVTMADGRVVAFAGKRRMIKDILTDQAAGTVAVRFDFRNGQTLTAVIPQHHVLYAAGHGYSQKLGDEVAGAKNEDGTPASEEDMYLAVEALHQRLNESTDWNRVKSGEESVSGASIVLKAIMEVSGKSLAEVKAFIEKKLTDAAERGQKLTRAALYASFRNPTSKTGEVIARLEKEKLAKAPAVDADALMSELG